MNFSFLIEFWYLFNRRGRLPLLTHLVVLVVLGRKVLVVVIVIHFVVLELLSSLLEVNGLSASAPTSADDVVGGDGLEGVLIVLVICGRSERGQLSGLQEPARAVQRMARKGRVWKSIPSLIYQSQETSQSTLRLGNLETMSSQTHHVLAFALAFLLLVHAHFHGGRVLGSLALALAESIGGVVAQGRSLIVVTHCEEVGRRRE